MLNLLNETFSSLLQPFSFKYLALLAIFLIPIYKWFSTSANSSPPSPPKLPVIGNLHQLGQHLQRSLQTLAQRHGPLMLLHFGSVPVLVVSSDETAREIMKTHDITFANRPKNTFFKKFCYNFKDVASAPYGEYWTQLKSICVLNLLSNTRVRSFRAVREEETKSMIDNITKHCSSSPSSVSSAFNLSEMLETLTNDVICRVALGRKYSDGGERGRTFKKLAEELSLVMSRIHIGDYIPWLAWIARLNGLDAKFDDLAKWFDEFLEIIIQEHMDEFDGLTKNEDQKDFVDVLLSLQADSPIDRVSIKAIILVAAMLYRSSEDCFATTSSTLNHAKCGISILVVGEEGLQRVCGEEGLKRVCGEEGLKRVCGEEGLKRVCGGFNNQGVVWGRRRKCRI